MQLLTSFANFYILIGTASATLVGLIFVATSIGAGVFNAEHQAGIRSFLSPTVAHFTAILVMSLLAIVPTANGSALGLLEAAVGAIGVGYSLWIWRRMLKHGLIGSIDYIDRLWYALLPIAAYLVVIVAGANFSQYPELSANALAAALILLLLIGIRNAWDMTVWVISRQKQ